MYVSSGTLQIWMRDSKHARLLNSKKKVIVKSSGNLTVEVQCYFTGNASSQVLWSYGDNDTVVLEGLRPFGTSQGDGWLRIYPSNIISPNGTVFKCTHVDDEETLEVTFVACELSVCMQSLYIVYQYIMIL